MCLKAMTGMIRVSRSSWIPWLCLACRLSAVEYELSGSYEYFDRRPTAEEFESFKEFSKRHPREEVIAEHTKRFGYKSELMKGEPRSRGEGGSRFFKIWVRDHAWCIHTRRLSDPPHAGWEHGSVDGKEMYMSVGNADGVGMGVVRKLTNSIPTGVSDRGVETIWLMTASGGFFDTLTNTLSGPVASETFRRAEEYVVGDHQPWLWIRREGKPGLPLAIHFLNGRGETNVSLRATGFREVGGLSLPAGFIWERSTPRVATLKGWVIRVEERTVARITNIVAHCSRKDLHPRVLSNMSVADFRVQQPTVLVTNISTNATAGITTNTATVSARKTYDVRDGKWPTTAKAQDLVDGRKQRPKDWIWAAVLAVVLLGGAVGWLRRRGRPVAPTQPPPPPTDAPSP